MNTTQNIIKIIIVLAAVGCMYLLALNDTRTRKSGEEYSCYATYCGEKIKVFTAGEENYLFLPSYMDSNLVAYSTEAQKLIDSHKLTILESDNINTIYIDTSSGSLDQIYADKNNKETGSIRVYDAKGNVDYSGGLKYITGHGNYSWNSEEWTKKPFNVCLNDSASLLGLGAGQKYTLIANASDATMVRNDIARSMEVALGVKYAHRGQFVDLYINREYMGNYYLCDNIEIGEDRINITNLESVQDEIYHKVNYEALEDYDTGTLRGKVLPEEVEDITGGYLIEREFIERFQLNYYDNPSSFVINGVGFTDIDMDETIIDEDKFGEAFLVKSPKYCSENEIKYICQRLEEIDAAITNPEGVNTQTGISIDEYIDMESFAERYLAEEITMNYDAGISSAFFYKDSDLVDSKLYYGPGWDYDMSLGNCLDWMEYSIDQPEGLTFGVSCSGANRSFQYLYRQADFRSLAITKYATVLRPYISELLDGGIDELKNMLVPSAAMDALRWKDMYDACGYTAGSEEAFVALEEFISRRIQSIDETWILR